MNKFIHSFVIASATFFLLTALNTMAATTWAQQDNVAINKQWSIKLNQPIDRASIANNVYILEGSTKVPVTASVKANTIVVKPKNNLKYNTSYKLVVSNKVKNTKGTTIKDSITVPFVTKKAPVKTEKVTAVETFQSEYAMTWNLPAVNYKNFRLVGTNAKGQIVGGYETKPGTTHFGIKIGASKSTVTNKYGQPVKAILKNNVNYTQNYKDNEGNTTSGTYLIDGNYVTFFYDIHAKNTVRSIQWVTKEIEATKNGFFKTNPTTAFRKSQEDLMVHLINQARVAEGLDALKYTPSYNSIARKHSIDMADNNYFNHTNLKGKNAKDRMNDGNLQFSWYGENIAYGQYSSIYAHEALMNSMGHRENILREKFTRIISGVAFNEKGKPYYTQNFYRP